MKTITLLFFNVKSARLFHSGWRATLCPSERFIRAGFISLFIFSFSLSYGQSWDWGAEGRGSIKTNDFGSPVATDKNGNAYIAGQYGTKVIFGLDTLKGSSDNAYLVKYNSSGSILWAVQPIDSSTSCYSFGASVATDKSGNIYICGMFENTIKFGLFTLRAKNYESVFLAKYSPSGNVLWAKQSVAPRNYNSTGYSVTTDNLGGVFITGFFTDTISFGAYTLKTGYTNAYTVFIAKYDTLGNVIWARQSVMPSSTCFGVGNSITSDNLGNVYITGYFRTAIFFGSSQLVSLNNYSAFLAKYSSGGNLLWAKQNINLNPLISVGYGYSAITDNESNSYITGYFEDSVQFGSFMLNSPSEYGAFLVKYDTGGNVLWAKQSSVGWVGTALCSDTLNHIYMTGQNTISDSIFMVGGFILHAVPWASSNSILIKLDDNGNPLCGSILENLGVGSNYEPIGITSDPSGNYIYIAGTFDNDTIKCGNDTLVSNTGGAAPFVGRWLNCSQEEGINPITSSNPSVTLFPNPNNGIFTIALSHPPADGSQTIEIYNVLGEKVFDACMPQTPKGALNEINISSQPNGIYLYRVISESGALIGEGKIIIEK